MRDTAARWREIQTLLDAALDQRVEDRAAFLDDVCASDEWLRTEVGELACACQMAGDYLETPMAAAAAPLIEEQAHLTYRAGVAAGGTSWFAADGFGCIPVEQSRDDERPVAAGAPLSLPAGGHLPAWSRFRERLVANATAAVARIAGRLSGNR